MSENKALTIPVVETLKAELEKRREARLQGKIGNLPRGGLILSDIGDCNRQMAYGVANWKDKPKITTDLAARFEVGNLWEREMIREIMGMGFEFEGGQDSVSIKGKGGKEIARGRIDGFVVWEGERIPCEFKSMSPNVFNGVESVEDFQKKPWLRKYTRQLQMYMFGHNKEYGLFGLTNCLGLIKWFILYLDLGECELILQRLEKTAAHLEAGTLPERIEYRDEICGRCDFAHICLPDVMRTEAEILTNEALISELEEREKLKAAQKRYKELDDSVKSQLRGIKKGVAGDFMVVGKPTLARVQEAYEVKEGWKVDIKYLGIKKSKEATNV